MEDKQKATIYFKSDLGGSINRIEGYLISHQLTDYAQYKDTPKIKFILKGKRHITTLIKGFKPFYLILAGWNTPLYSDDEGFNIKKEGVTTIKESKYLSFDDGYILDFNRFINPLLKKEVVIADYRYLKDDYHIKNDSLLNAIENKDEAKIKEIEEKANNGEVVRII